MTAARPKWLVCYGKREFDTVEGNKVHVNPFFEYVFNEDENMGVSREEFGGRIKEMEYKQQLGGPYMPVKDGQDMEGCEAGEMLFDLFLTQGGHDFSDEGGEVKVVWNDVERKLREWSKGEDGITWDKWWMGVGDE